MKSTVYFSRLSKSESAHSIILKIKQIWRSAGFPHLINKDDFVAIKLHLGEEGGAGFIKPHFVQPIVEAVKEKRGKPFLTETATLYKGKRTNAVDHLALAYEHGFTPAEVGCPVIMADGLKGEYQFSRRLKSNLVKYAHIAGLISFVNTIIGLGHPTGHVLTGYGGAIKNIGMGLASRGGKLAEHSGLLPQVDKTKCTGCGSCMMWCPADAITITKHKMKINPDKCYGCGECFSVCPNEAIKIAWDESSANVQRKIVRYAAEVLKSKKSGFINFGFHITADCDCMGKTGQPIISDLGILASFDPVALDQATIDIINNEAGQDVFKQHWSNLDYTIQLTYGEEIGLGTRSYQLKEL